VPARHEDIGPARGIGRLPGWFFPIRRTATCATVPAPRGQLKNDIVRAARGSRSRTSTPACRYIYGTARARRRGSTRLLPDRQGSLAEAEPKPVRHLARWFADEEWAHANATARTSWLDGRPPGLSPKAALDAKTTEDERLPWFLKKGQKTPNLSGLLGSGDLVVDRPRGETARVRGVRFLYEGRRYNVTTDLLVVPADRFSSHPRLCVSGYEIPRESIFHLASCEAKGPPWASRKASSWTREQPPTGALSHDWQA